MSYSFCFYHSFIINSLLRNTPSGICFQSLPEAVFAFPIVPFSSGCSLAPAGSLPRTRFRWWTAFRLLQFGWRIGFVLAVLICKSQGREAPIPWSCRPSCFGRIPALCFGYQPSFVCFRALVVDRTPLGKQLRTDDRLLHLQLRQLSAFWLGSVDLGWTLALRLWFIRQRYPLEPDVSSLHSPAENMETGLTQRLSRWTWASAASSDMLVT